MIHCVFFLQVEDLGSYLLRDQFPPWTGKSSAAFLLSSRATVLNLTVEAVKAVFTKAFITSGSLLLKLCTLLYDSTIQLSLWRRDR